MMTINLFVVIKVLLQMSKNCNGPIFQFLDINYCLVEENLLTTTKLQVNIYALAYWLTDIEGKISRESGPPNFQ